ncbi:uncharacterized protein B0H18DRAFT_838660, partial [Fomitopsis serialis]|uniref:uncharacterized protein n=1 Tax=Fomitopsis serialis TaxID=139415 RepID=UPI002007E56D
VVSASAWFLTNVTVDDTDGDVATGAQFSYHPAELWSVQQNCTESEIQTVCPNVANAYDKTWHAGAEYEPGWGLPSAEISFTGSALYVYCIVVPNLTTDLTFFIDGDTAGTYTQNANPYDAGIVQYNTLVYANDTIPWGTHTFTLLSGATADAQASTLAVLDYIVYT